IFPKVIVAVGPNPAKEVLFTVKDRLEMIRQSVRRIRSIEVASFEGLIVDFLRKKRAHVILRGIRTFSDYEYEFQMALTNRSISQTVETVFIMPAEEYSYISSRLVKEVAGHGGDVSAFVPPPVLRRLRKMLDKKR
ncbi:MAG: pantetheine-phosphate adenylyltransferase, partial [Planctomycetota bacterium]|nr:pantetheine-phosphate adenylyltransferase [Planctomycetota bacterium]